MNNEAEQVRDILRALTPFSVLVGSAVKRDTVGDIDLVIGCKGLRVAKRVFPPGWESLFIGHLKTFDTGIPIEVFYYWYGPGYAELVRRKDLTKRVILGVSFRAWPHHRDTRLPGGEHYGKATPNPWS